MKLEFSQPSFEKSLKYQISRKYVHCEPSCSMWTDRRTVMTKLIVASRYFVEAPNERKLNKCKTQERTAANSPECRFSRSTFRSAGETPARWLVKPSSLACIILILGTRTQAIRGTHVSFGEHLPAVVSSRWPNQSYVRLLIIIGFRFARVIKLPLSDTRSQTSAVCCVQRWHKQLRMNFDL
jgi:hypothetical protein